MLAKITKTWLRVIGMTASTLLFGCTNMRTGTLAAQRQGVGLMSQEVADKRASEYASGKRRGVFGVVGAQLQIMGGGLLPPDPATWVVLTCRFDGLTCIVPVSFSAASVDTNECSIAVPTVVRFARPVKALQWRLDNNGVDGKIKFRFVSSTGLEIDDNDAGGGVPVFVKGTPMDDINFSYDIRVRLLKTFGYTVRLEWQNPETKEWRPCHPFDPLIVNMG